MNDLLSGVLNSNEQLIGLVLTVLAVVFIVSLLRSVFRLFMPVMVIGLVMVVFLGFTPTEVIEKGKQYVKDGSYSLLEGIAPFIKQDGGGINKNGELGIPPEHDPKKDGESNPKLDEDIDIFGEQDKDDLVNQF